MKGLAFRAAPIVGLLSFCLAAPARAQAPGARDGVFGDPVVAFLLLFVGLVLVGAEILAPGGVSGVVGALAVVGAFFMLARMPANAGGIALIVAGVALMVLEPLLGGLGIFGLAGAAAAVAGGLVLFDDAADVEPLSPWIPIACGAAAAMFFAIAMRAVIKARRRPVSPASGEDLAGEEAVVVTMLDPDGVVRVRNESWSARARGGVRIEAGARARIIAVHGLTLEVEPLVRPEMEAK